MFCLGAAAHTTNTMDTVLLAHLRGCLLRHPTVLLRPRRPLSPYHSSPRPAAAHFMRMMVEVVRHAHALGICHRHVA